VRFLARKLAEFDSLMREIELLKTEVGPTAANSLQK